MLKKGFLLLFAAFCTGMDGPGNFPGFFYFFEV